MGVVVACFLYTFAGSKRRRHHEQGQGTTQGDYNEDLRFAPAPETASKAELIDRAERLIKAVVSGGAPRGEDSEQEKPKP